MAKDHASPLPPCDQDRPARACDLVALARAQPLTDGGLRTSALLQQALADDPCHHDAHILTERLHQLLVPRWHFPMLADKTRNRAYARAIAATVKPGDVVLDIGCGAGLTAMLAARAGAAHVYSCEQQPLIAQAARRVIARNGLSDRITVIAKPSHALRIGTDLPARADVLLSEVVDTVLLGEGALATLVDAVGRLLRPGGRAIPGHGRLRAQLVESRRLAAQWRPQEAEGFALDAFHRFATVAQITPGEAATLGLRPLGPATDLFHFDFRRPGLAPGQAVRHLDCTEAGTIHAVLVFFEMTLAPGIALSNGLTSGGHWGRTAFLTDRSLSARPGERLSVTAQHDSTQLSLVAEDHLSRDQGPDLGAAWLDGAGGAPVSRLPA